MTSEGSGSCRNLTSKIDDVGSGAASLSRLAGLGRDGRRELTAILDEFWGQMFDFHGQITQEAKAKKLNVLLGVDSRSDSKSTFSSVQLANMSKTSTGYIPLFQFVQRNAGLPLGLQPRSSIYSNPAQLLDVDMWNSGLSIIDSGERHYHSVRVPSSSDVYDQQPATIHGYNLSSYLGQFAKEKGSGSLKGELESLLQNSPPSIDSNSMDSYGQLSGLKPHGGGRNAVPPGFHNVPAFSRSNSLKSERPPSLGLYSAEPVNYMSNPSNARKFLSLPNVSGLYIPQPDSPLSVNNTLPDKSVIHVESTDFQACEPKFSSGSSWASATPGSNASPSKVCRDAFSLQFGASSGMGSLWSKQPYEQFGVDKSPSISLETTSILDVEVKLLQSFRSCIIKLLKLEGSDWLFKQNDGVDEDIISSVSMREKILYEVGKVGSAKQMNEAIQLKFMSVPNCGEGCVWGVDLIICFGVWCIHRILDLSLMESRPELWGKYTYILNRLQVPFQFFKTSSFLISNN